MNREYDTFLAYLRFFRPFGGKRQSRAASGIAERSLPPYGNSDRWFLRLFGSKRHSRADLVLRMRQMVYSSKDFESLEEYMVELHWSINDMDNALYETDVYTPMKFFEIAGALAPVIKYVRGCCQ